MRPFLEISRCRGQRNGMPPRGVFSAFALGTVFVFAAQAPATPSRSPEESLRRIDETLRRPTRSAFQRERNVQTARDMIARFTAEYPGPEYRGAALLYSARSAAMLEDFALARNLADSAMAMPLTDSRRMEAEFILGMASIRMGETARGAQVLRELLARRVRHEIVPEARILLAQTLAENGDGAGATALLDSVIREGRPDWAVERARLLRPGYRRIGQPAIDFAARALDGSSIRLSDYAGRVVLLDFWATWCGPCRTTIPEIAQLYERYHAQGFDVIGVSLDTNEEALRSFIATYRMPWQQVFEGEGWQSEIGRTYGVNGIPALFVIDRRGRIRGNELRGRPLEEMVQRLLRE